MHTYNGASMSSFFISYKCYRHTTIFEQETRINQYQEIQYISPTETMTIYYMKLYFDTKFYLRDRHTLSMNTNNQQIFN